MVGILTKNSYEKLNAPHVPGVPPSGLTSIDALPSKSDQIVHVLRLETSLTRNFAAGLSLQIFKNH